MVFRARYKLNPIFIPHHVSLHKHTIRPYNLHWNQNTWSCSSKLILYYPNLATTITYLFDKLNDNCFKINYKLKEYVKNVNATITDQDENIYKKLEICYRPRHSRSKRIH